MRLKAHPDTNLLTVDEFVIHITCQDGRASQKSAHRLRERKYFARRRGTFGVRGLLFWI
jgi:hypothetical protein